MQVTISHVNVYNYMQLYRYRWAVVLHQIKYFRHVMLAHNVTPKTDPEIFNNGEGERNIFLVGIQ